MSKPNGILAMNPEKYREIDGVVFDLDSYARHCKPPEQEKTCEDTPKSDDNPAETCRPLRLLPFSRPTPTWTAGIRPRTVVRPCHHGRRCPPRETEDDVIREENGTRTVIQTVYFAAGSVPAPARTTSYTTASATVSGSFGSGSGFSGSYAFGSCVYTAGGYGLELI